MAYVQYASALRPVHNEVTPSLKISTSQSTDADNGKEKEVEDYILGEDVWRIGRGMCRVT